MSLPPPESIQQDIYKLVGQKIKCQANEEALEKDIRRLREEQNELRALVDDPGPYDVDSLQANIDRIDGHILRIQGVIQFERDKVDQLDYIIGDLEERKCRSGLMSLSTGIPHQGS